LFSGFSELSIINPESAMFEKTKIIWSGKNYFFKASDFKSHFGSISTPVTGIDFFERKKRFFPPICK